MTYHVKLSHTVGYTNIFIVLACQVIYHRLDGFHEDHESNSGVIHQATHVKYHSLTVQKPCQLLTAHRTVYLHVSISACETPKLCVTVITDHDDHV